MDFKVFRYYVIVCRLIEVEPTFKGLYEFKKFYYWECECNGRGKLGKDSDRYV